MIFKEFISSGQPNVFDKKQLEKKLQIKIKGSGVGWIYQWSGNGMLSKVTLPMGSEVNFNYDPLGRRIAKQYKGRVTRWLWDGNVPLHEWNYEGEYPPKLSIDETDSLKEAQEPTENVITWLFEEGSFVPCGKIINDQQYSIVTDYLGTPNFMYNAQGEKVWECVLDVYGKVRNLQGALNECPFRYQGQYEDVETGLCYQRYRYYSEESGMYLSQDPIGLEGGLTLFGYVNDNNFELDPLGEAVQRGKGAKPWMKPGAMREHHTIPQEMLGSKAFVQRLKDLGIENPKSYIDRQIVRIENVFHDTLHEGPRGGIWNDTFKDWFEENRDFSKKGLQRQIRKMMKDFNVPMRSRNFARKYKRKDKKKFKPKHH